MAQRSPRSKAGDPAPNSELGKGITSAYAAADSFRTANLVSRARSGDVGLCLADAAQHARNILETVWAQARHLEKCGQTVPDSVWMPPTGSYERPYLRQPEQEQTQEQGLQLEIVRDPEQDLGVEQ